MKSSRQIVCVLLLLALIVDIADNNVMDKGKGPPAGLPVALTMKPIA